MTFVQKADFIIWPNYEINYGTISIVRRQEYSKNLIEGGPGPEQCDNVTAASSDLNITGHPDHPDNQ